MRSVFQWVVVGDVIISCSSAGEIPMETWRSYQASIASCSKCLGLSIGNTSINSIQRKEVNEMMKRRALRVVSVSDDSLVRGIVTAISWFGVDIKAYSWANLKDAVNHLGIPPHDAEPVIFAAERLRRSVEAQVALER